MLRKVKEGGRFFILGGNYGYLKNDIMLVVFYKYVLSKYVRSFVLVLVVSLL